MEWQNDGEDTAGHSAAYKFREGLDAPDGGKTTSRLPSVQETHAKLTPAWKRPLLKGGTKLSASRRDCVQVPTITRLAEHSYEPLSEPAAFVWIQLTFPVSLSKLWDPP